MQNNLILRQYWEADFLKFKEIVLSQTLVIIRTVKDKMNEIYNKLLFDSRLAQPSRPMKLGLEISTKIVFRFKLKNQ